jgi:O-acetyl-ADP-ribose deacetylase (regulator of RNase III)
MFRITEGNLLQSSAQALVNTVNTVGVMGKGIALQFKRAFPDNFEAYNKACQQGTLQIGHMFVCETGLMTNPRYVINFPTKTHWRAKSRLEDIEVGLTDLKRVIIERHIQSIALPPLGCGNGGLNWTDVEPIIVESLSDLADVDIELYAPKGAPSASEMPNRTERPIMDQFAAAVLLGIERYISLSVESGLSAEPKVSMLEVQKVGYFLQLAGWPLHLSFSQGHYGPYAHNLDRFLSAIEGHFVSGYGDGTGGAKATLSLEPLAVKEACNVLSNNINFIAALERFENIICGFEFPYGVELLSTVHYAALTENSSEQLLDAVLRRIREWSPRKQSMFKREQAVVAYERLAQCDLIPS